MTVLVGSFYINRVYLCIEFESVDSKEAYPGQHTRDYISNSIVINKDGAVGSVIE